MAFHRAVSRGLISGLGKGAALENLRPQTNFQRTLSAIMDTDNVTYGPLWTNTARSALLGNASVVYGRSVSDAILDEERFDKSYKTIPAGAISLSYQPLIYTLPRLAYPQQPIPIMVLGKPIRYVPALSTDSRQILLGKESNMFEILSELIFATTLIILVKLCMEDLTQFAVYQDSSALIDNSPEDFNFIDTTNQVKDVKTDVSNTIPKTSEGKHCSEEPLHKSAKEHGIECNSGSNSDDHFNGDKKPPRGHKWKKWALAAWGFFLRELRKWLRDKVFDFVFGWVLDRMGLAWEAMKKRLRITAGEDELETLKTVEVMGLDF